MPFKKLAESYRRFRKLLRQARLDAGLSQRQAAAKLGRLQAFISKVETGERRVDVVELEVFARLYGKPMTYFFPKVRAPHKRRRKARSSRGG